MKKIMGLFVIMMLVTGCSTENTDLNLEIQRLTQENETLKDEKRLLETQLEDQKTSTFSGSILDIEEATLQDGSLVHIVTVRVFQTDEFRVLKHDKAILLDDDQVYNFMVEAGYITSIKPTE